jgi:peptidoglycan hydrolase-like protein with peptidoglycan-binding domain
MKKLTILISVIFVALIISTSGCKKAEQQTALTDTEAMDEMGITLPEGTQTVTLNEVVAPPAAGEAVEKIEVSVQDASKPSPQQIQTCLKNAGLYTGAIDGKIGPKSKKAIKDFQAANGLVADGVVGKKTWAKLQEYLAGPKIQQ